MVRFSKPTKVFLKGSQPFMSDYWTFQSFTIQFYRTILPEIDSYEEESLVTVLI